MMLPPKKDLPDYYELIKVSSEDDIRKKIIEIILFRGPLTFKRFEIVSAKRIIEILKI